MNKALYNEMLNAAFGAIDGTDDGFIMRIHLINGEVIDHAPDDPQTSLNFIWTDTLELIPFSSVAYIKVDIV